MRIQGYVSVVGKALHSFCDGILEISCEMQWLVNILMEK
jgi:hypothetical protein